MILSQLQRGERAKVLGFVPGHPYYRSKLLALGLIPGTVFTLKRIAPLGCPVEIEVRHYALTLRKKEAELLKIERVA